MALLFVTLAFACIMADAGAGPHIVHGPYYRFAGSQNLADGVERQHSLVDPVQMDDICLLKFGKRSDVVPVLAISTAKRSFFLKRLAFQMTMRSHMNFHTCSQLPFSPTTLIWSVCLSRTNIFALMPLFLSDSISRPAATAAPPIRSEVLMISTLMLSKCLHKSSGFQ